MTVSLERRPLGSTGYFVHPICIGCAALGSMPATFDYAVSEEGAASTLRAAFESEINFLDTAAIYGYDRAAPDGFGESERRVGRAIRDRGGLPAGFVLSTKADRDPAAGRFDGGQARRSVEGSRERLGFERLQIVYLHDPEYCSWDEIVGPGGALEILRRYREDGVIEHLGLAGGPPEELQRYLDLGGFEVLISHNRYTLLDRSAEQLFRQAHAQGVAVVNAAPYGSGILAKGPGAYPRYMYRAASSDLVERARRVEAVCSRYEVPMAAAALQFSLRASFVTATIVGMTRPERIAQTLELARQAIPEAIWSELDRATGFAD